MSVSQKQYENIGTVEIRRSERFRRLSIKVDVHANVVVNLPYGISVRTMDKFVLSHQDWIMKARSKVKALKGENTVFSLTSEYNTAHFKIRFVSSNKSSYSIVGQTNDSFTIGIPNNLSEEEIRSIEVQAKLAELVAAVLRYEARLFLPQQTARLAEKYGFEYQKLSFRNNKTNWGSCSSRNNISLNVHLMRLPAHLCEYVILHELCHTRVKDHSERFWQLMSEVCPNALMYRKELRHYSTTIF